MAERKPAAKKAAAKAKVEAGLAGYVEVHERIAAFVEANPEGSLQAEFEIREIGDNTVIIVKAYAYRTPDDPRPGIGWASEPYPGKTPYTRDSELENGETSAWGRAIAALGFEVHRGVASANEVRSKSSGDEAKGFASDKQRGYLTRLLKEAKADPTWIDAVAREMDEAPRSGISKTIDRLGPDSAEAEELAAKLVDAAKQKAGRENLGDTADLEGLEPTQEMKQDE